MGFSISENTLKQNFAYNTGGVPDTRFDICVRTVLLMNEWTDKGLLS